MAIKISGTTVIDDSRNIVNGVGINISGVATATSFSGSGASLTSLSADNISSGTLAIARGGTNGSATPSAGAIAYGTGSAYAFSSAGSSSQVLLSGGTGAPTWTNQSSLSVGSATTATDATNFTVTANNSTNETVYPVFVDGATGSQGAETDTALSYNPSTNILTAGTFSGSGASLTSLSADNISSGTLAIARGGTNGSATPTAGGAAYGTGSAYAFTSAGTAGQVLTSNGTSAPTWEDAAAGGGGGDFNVGITSATGYLVTTSMATAYTAPAASGSYVIKSIHITNIDGTNSADISGQLYGTTSFAHTVPVPPGSSVELLKQPKVLSSGETIQLQASASNDLHATITIEPKAGDTTYIGAGVDITSAATYTDLWTATGNAVIQSVLLANDDGGVDVKARVVWTNASNTIQGYYAYDMTIPADATVEILEQPKFLPSGFKVRVYANQANRLEAILSAKLV